MVPESPPPALVSNTPASTTAVSTTPTRPNPLQDRLPQDRLRLKKSLPKTTPPLVKALNMQVEVFRSSKVEEGSSGGTGCGGGLDVPEDAADGVEDKGKGKKPVKNHHGRRPSTQGQADGQEDSATEANSGGAGREKRKRVDDETCGDGPAQEKGKQSDLVAADQSRRPTRVCAPLKARAAPGSPVVKSSKHTHLAFVTANTTQQSIFVPIDIFRGLREDRDLMIQTAHPSSVLIGATSFDADLACPVVPE
ncbi:hypothetical protein B0H19DRAFT_1086517 [Mycena capillaripes]|nr:hypothetical protein B0H19DRAFT_1086517 [Mycena capillaripes]